MRYLKVRGRPGVLVANPHMLTANPPQYAGQRRKKDAAKLREQVERYDPCEEVVLDEPSLRKAITRDELELLGVGNGKDAASVVWVAPAPGKDS